MKLSYETLKTILDNAFDEVFVYDNNYNILYVNKACERHYGMKQEDMIGKNFWQFVDEDYWYPSTLPIVYKEKRRVTMEQKSYLGETLITTSVPIFDENKDIKLVVMSVRDSMYELDSIREQLEIQSKKQDYKHDNNKKNLQKNKIIYTSNKMKQLINMCTIISKVDTTILVRGESGTGKGLLVEYIHENSNRSKKSLLTINCAAIPETLLESELFGYEKGAFTGAIQTGKVGLIELANHGTLFLDEIGEISPGMQAKLLRVIQEKKFIPIGGKCEREVDIRIITATNKDLYSLVQEGKFREDLYWRLNVIDLEIPSLRQRRDDIISLATYFLNKFNKKYKYSKVFESECLDFFLYYSWPGNIRQLENLVERLVVTSKESTIYKNDIPSIYLKDEINLNNKYSYKDSEIDNYIFEFEGNIKEDIVDFDKAIKEYEEKIVLYAYKKNNTSRKLAQKLNISQSKASRLIRKYCDVYRIR